MDDEIERKKMDFSAAWQEYFTADQKAENNRGLVREARAHVFETFTRKSAIDPAYFVLCVAEEKQAEFDEEAIRLGRRFDQIAKDLGKSSTDARKRGDAA